MFLQTNRESRHDPVGEVNGELIKWFVNPGVRCAYFLEEMSMVFVMIAMSHIPKYMPSEETIALYCLKAVDLVGALNGIDSEAPAKELFFCSLVLVEDGNQEIPFDQLDIYNSLGWKLPVFGLAEYVMQTGLDPVKVWCKILKKDRRFILKGSPGEIIKRLGFSKKSS